ncbi:MAG TPA: 3-oxoacyl-ACP synthase, partial [Actinomycetota bacterium]|nr:3-oxoacyl-ACP synthase [Actinomycetota bacterium]
MKARVLSTGFHVPARVVTNAELTGYMDTSDEWIRQRSGIEERRWVDEGVGGSDLARIAAEMALERAAMSASGLDCVIVATLSPDHFFPGTGVFLQR